MKMFKFGPLTFLWNASPLTIASLQLNRAFNRATEAAARLNGPLREAQLEIDSARDVAPRLVDTCEAKKNGWPNYIGWACRPCSAEWPFPSSSKPDCIRRSLPRDKGPRPYHWRDNQNERRADLDWPLSLASESRPWALNVPDPAAAMRVEGEIEVHFPEVRIARCEKCGTDYTPGDRFDFCPHEKRHGDGTDADNGRFVFPDRPIVPTTPLVFDDRELRRIRTDIGARPDAVIITPSGMEALIFDHPPCEHLAPLMTGMADHIASFCKKRRVDGPTPCDWPCCSCASDALAARAAGEPLRYTVPAEADLPPDIVAANRAATDARPCAGAGTPSQALPQDQARWHAEDRAGPPTPRAGKPFDVC